MLKVAGFPDESWQDSKRANMTEDSKRTIEKWYGLYWEAIFAWARRTKGWSKETAEDIAQNVFAKIIDTASGSLPDDPESLEAKRKIRSWRRIAERQETRQEGFKPLPPDDSFPSDEPDLLAAHILLQETEEAMKAIERLDSRYGSVLLLHDYEGYKHKEIAEKLGIPENTSRSRLKRAREQIRTMLLQKRRRQP